MSPEELKARARRAIEEVLNQGDLAVATKLIPPAALTTSPATSPCRARGPGRLLALTQCIFPDFHAVVEDEFAECGQVVQRITCYGTPRGEFPARRVAGRPVPGATRCRPPVPS